MTAAFDLDEMEVAEEVVDPNEKLREEWMQKRSGRITCSQFGKLIGKGRGKNDIFTQTGMAYLRLKVAEKLGSWHSVSAKSMEWGTNNEAAAIDAYRELTGREVDSQPFQFFTFNEHVGGTPDGLVGETGCIEVKCPYDPAVHVNTLLTREVPKEYVWQVLGHLLVTNRKWCDFGSFDPRMNGPERLCVIRVDRDEERIQFLLERIRLATEEVQRMLKHISPQVYESINPEEA